MKKNEELIHKFRLNGRNIVLDVGSGAVHVFDHIAYGLLDCLTPEGEWDRLMISGLENKYGLAHVNESILEILELMSSGLLFTDDMELSSYETSVTRADRAEPDQVTQYMPMTDQAISKRIVPDRSRNSYLPVVKSMCLHVSHDCNMRCGYCFACEGDFGTGRKLMDGKTAKAAVEFLIRSSGGRKNLEIDFFGGEPLMNFDVVVDTAEYAMKRAAEEKRHIRMTLTTNALLLDDEKNKVINRLFDNVVLSLDGRPGINDRVRKTVSGAGTYGVIAPKIAAFIKERTANCCISGNNADSGNTNYYVRGTFTGLNPDFAADVLHIAGMGINNISLEPVVVHDGSVYEITSAQLPSVLFEYEKLAMEYVKRKLEGADDSFEFFHFNIDLENGPCVHKRMRGCGAGLEYVAVTPEGDIYPCHQFVGLDDFKIGDIFAGIYSSAITGNDNDAGVAAEVTSEITAEVTAEVTAEACLDLFRGNNLLQKPGCRQCWARYYCGGGCAANAWKHNGTLEKPYELGCILEKKRIECALWIKAELGLKTGLGQGQGQTEQEIDEEVVPV